LGASRGEFGGVGLVLKVVGHCCLYGRNWVVSRHSDAVFSLLNIGEATEYPDKENP
jgi:hypothetical protein